MKYLIILYMHDLSMNVINFFFHKLNHNNKQEMQIVQTEPDQV